MLQCSLHMIALILKVAVPILVSLKMTLRALVLIQKVILLHSASNISTNSSSIYIYYTSTGSDTGSDIGGTSNKPKPAIVPISWSPQQKKKPIHQRLGPVNVPTTYHKEEEIQAEKDSTYLQSFTYQSKSQITVHVLWFLGNRNQLSIQRSNNK